MQAHLNDRRAQIVSLTLLLGLYLLLAGIYLFLVPPLDSPDTGGHLRYVWFLQTKRSLPTLSADEAFVSHEVVQQPPLYYAVAALLAPPDALDAARRTVIESPYVAEGSAQRHTVVTPGAPRSALAVLLDLRLLALAGGLATVFGTWLLARELLPERRVVALLAAALVAFNPQFLCISTAISNDAWLAGASAIAVWFGARAARRLNGGFFDWLLAGLAAGIAALCKYSGLVVILPLATLWLAAASRRGWRHRRAWLASSAALALGFLASAGWWFARNLALHGELVPLRAMLPLLPGLARTTPLSFSSLLQSLAWLPRSYWAVFGYGVHAPDIVYYAAMGLMMAGLAGCIWFALRRGAADGRFTLLVLALWLLATLLSLINWLRLVLYADQGRLLYGAAPAVALLIALGLSELVAFIRTRRLAAYAPLLLAGLALAPLPTLRQAYTPPPALTSPIQPQRPINFTFAGGMRLLGIDLPDGAFITSGGSLRVRLYLACDSPIAQFYKAFLHLTDDRGAALFRLDAAPAGGRHTTRQWQPGVVFVDEYLLTVGDLPREELARLTYGYYPAGNPATGEELLIAGIRLHPSPLGEQLPEPLASWGNGIRLYSAQVEKDAGGIPARIELAWGTTAMLQSDYTVSVQWLDAEGKLLAQVDQEPESGQYPSSTWQPGGLVRDTYTLPADAASWRRVIVLLYGRDGTRLRLPDGADHWVLAER